MSTPASYFALRNCQKRVGRTGSIGRSRDGAGARSGGGRIGRIHPIVYRKRRNRKGGSGEEAEQGRAEWSKSGNGKRRWKAERNREMREWSERLVRRNKAEQRMGSDTDTDT